MAGSKGNTKKGQKEDPKDKNDSNEPNKSKTDDPAKGDSQSQREKTQTSDSEGRSKTNKKSDTEESKQREYFKEELKRLKKSLEREKSKIARPEVKNHTPDTFNTLAPYYNTYSADYLIERPNEVDHVHSSRPTAQGLCDPWVDHEMDNTLLPMSSPRASREAQEWEEEQQEEEESEGRPKKEGSTHLPKYPAVKVPAGDLATRTLYYSDVPMLREELKKTYSSSASSKTEEEYKRTKQDFYRMELDKIEEYHPVNQPIMKATYYAYLQNNPGSRKAIVECVKAAEKKQEEKEQKSKEGTPRSQSGTPTQTPRSRKGTQSPQTSTPRSARGGKQQAAKGSQKKAVKA